MRPSRRLIQSAAEHRLLGRAQRAATLEAGEGTTVKVRLLKDITGAARASPSPQCHVLPLPSRPTYRMAGPPERTFWDTIRKVESPYLALVTLQEKPTVVNPYVLIY